MSIPLLIGLTVPSLPGEASVHNPEQLGASVPENGQDHRRILVISDVHGNWPALAAVIQDAAGRYDSIWFLGDLVGYGPFPAECVRFIRDYVGAAHVRVGNHDLGLFDRVPGFKWNGHASTTLDIHRAVLQSGGGDAWAWLDQVFVYEDGGPTVVDYGATRFVMTHANLQNNMDLYLFPRDCLNINANIGQLREFVTPHASRICLLAGHSHIPCFFAWSGATDRARAQPRSIRYGASVALDAPYIYLNPGSVGQPRDRNPDACYLILDTVDETVTWYRVPYDINATLGALTRQGYPRGLGRWLRDGGTQQTWAELHPIYRPYMWGMEVVQDC